MSDLAAWVLYGGAAGVTALMTAAVLVDWRWGLAKRRTAVWSDLAQRRGGRFVPAGSWLRSERAAIEHVVEHAVVLLDTYEQGSSVHTRARAWFAAGAGPRFSVCQEGALEALGKKMGGQDVVLGDDPAFDARFVVKCDDEASARRAWTHRARRLMYALERASVQSDGSLVTIELPGYREELSLLEGMLDLAGELASSGVRELEALADIRGARWIEAAPPWDEPCLPQVELDARGGTIVLRALPAASGPALQMTLVIERAVAPFSVDIEGGRFVQQAPRGLVSDSAVGLLASIGEATLTGDERRMRLTFPTLPAQARVEAGAALLDLIAAAQASAGAFR